MTENNQAGRSTVTIWGKIGQVAFQAAVAAITALLAASCVNLFH